MSRMQLMHRKMMTLIELLIVMAIVTLVIGIVGFNVYRLVVDQRFRNEVKMVVDHLRLAQNLMLIMESDVHVKFQERDGYILMSLESNEELEWFKRLNTEPKMLKVIHHVGFDEKGKEKISGLEERGVLDIKFLSGGTVMTSGILRLATARNNENALKRFVCLSGYPEPITVKMDFESCPSQEKESDFKERLTRATVQKIKEMGIEDEVEKVAGEKTQNAG